MIQKSTSYIFQVQGSCHTEKIVSWSRMIIHAHEFNAAAKMINSYKSVDAKT